MIRIYRPRRIKPKETRPLEKILRDYVKDNPHLEIERSREGEIIVYEIKEKVKL